MNCRTVEQLLSQQQDSPLPDNSAQELALHLEACPACRRYQKTLDTLQADLRALDQAVIPTSRLAQRAVAQWTDAKPSVAVPSLRSAWFRSALALALSLTLLAVGYGAVQFWRAQPWHPRFAGGRTGDYSRHYLATIQAQTTPPAETVKPLPGITILNGGKGGGKDIPPRHTPFHPDPRPLTTPAVSLVADMDYLNTDPAVTLACWTHIAPDEIAAMMEQLHASVCGGDEFVNVPLPQIAGQGDKPTKAAAEQYKQEAEIVDERLVKKVSLTEKGISFADLCRLLKEQTGIELTANASVADDKVTLFCKERSLRDIMRQVNRLFGYLWNRSGKPGEFRYELTQPVRAQLAEDELRSRDRNEALMALDREMERYRKYLNLTPEQAKEQAELVGPEDKPLLDSLAGSGWGPVHLYFGLSPQDMEALQNGQELNFADQPMSGQERPLPGGMSAGILGSLDKLRAHVGPNGELRVGPTENVPDGQPLSEVPGASARANLHLDTSDLGQVLLNGNSGAALSSSGTTPDGNMSGNNAVVMTGASLATGVSPSVGSPKNGAANAKLAQDPALRPHTTFTPQAASAHNSKATMVTTADVEEAIFKATGKDILADYYTRLYSPAQVMVHDKSLFDALNQVSDTMHDHWNWENSFLQFRSTGFFNDRLKEVPNRLLTRWAESRKQHGALSLEELIEMGQLTDRQLNAQTMAQGAEVLFGLDQWSYAQNMREDWRYLARLSPAQRKAAQAEKGLPYAKLPVLLQERFLVLLYGADADKIHLDSNDLTEAMLRVEYTLPEKPDAEGKTLPEPKITYQISGGSTVEKQTRTVTPYEEEIASPGNVRRRQNRRSPY
ncbi:MAG TPA: zf-HC2 domain-containing protein [Chthonomonadaceae bacterium]|nr:zf-HC2 domain-containing protein [Chthonomonadaceae bacterium]